MNREHVRNEWWWIHDIQDKLKSLKPSCGSVIRIAWYTVKHCSNPPFSLGYRKKKHPKVLENTKYIKGEFKSPSNENLVFHESPWNAKGSELHKPNRSLYKPFSGLFHCVAMKLIMKLLYPFSAVCNTIVTSFGLASIYEDKCKMLSLWFSD